jgi:hypothetical protein
MKTRAIPRLTYSLLLAHGESSQHPDTRRVRSDAGSQVAFVKWTRAGHPRFIGVRTDKAARGVRRERGNTARAGDNSSAHTIS